MDAHDCDSPPVRPPCSLERMELREAATKVTRSLAIQVQANAQTIRTIKEKARIWRLYRACGLF